MCLPVLRSSLPSAVAQPPLQQGCMSKRRWSQTGHFWGTAEPRTWILSSFFIWPSCGISLTNRFLQSKMNKCSSRHTQPQMGVGVLFCKWMYSLPTGPWGFTKIHGTQGQHYLEITLFFSASPHVGMGDGDVSLQVQLALRCKQRGARLKLASEGWASAHHLLAWLSLFLHLRLDGSFVVIVQLLSHVWLFAIPWTATHQAPLSFTIPRNLLKLMSIESVMLPNYLIVYCSLLLLPSLFPSIKVFSNELTLHIRGPKYWNFSFSISPSNEYSELISFRIDWFDLLAVQGTLKSLLQHHNSSLLSLLYGPTLTSVQDYWKNHSYWTVWTYVGKHVSALSQLRIY